MVLPLPGGPQRITDIGDDPVTSCRSGAPGASRWSWPTSSSRLIGRIRTGSGESTPGEESPATAPDPVCARAHTGGIAEGEQAVGFHQ